MARSAYHHGDLRAALVKAGLALLASDGPDAVSLRAAARMAGVSTAAPYKHFAHKTAFLTALAEAARLALSDAQAAAMADATDPRLAFRAMGVATVCFAVEHPALFALGSDARYLGAGDESAGALRTRLTTALHDALDSAAPGEPGTTALAASPAVIELASEALTYGLARMLLDGHLDPRTGAEPAGAGETTTFDTAEVARLTEAVLNVLGMGFMHGAPAPNGSPR